MKLNQSIRFFLLLRPYQKPNFNSGLEIYDIKIQIISPRAFNWLILFLKAKNLATIKIILLKKGSEDGHFLGGGWGAVYRTSNNNTWGE